MPKKYIKVSSNIFYELATLTHDVTCSKLQRDEENILVPFCLTNALFARFFSLNLSSKSPRQSLVKMKFESYTLHRWKKNCRKLVFWVFPEQLLSHMIFERLHCCKVTLVKKYNKPLLQKSETKIFDQKRFIKDLFQVNQKKTSAF